MASSNGIEHGPESSNGKLATRLDAALADYREKQAKRRERKAREERIRRAEKRAAGYDEDDEDDEPQEWEDDDEDDDKGPIYPNVPAEVDWEDFLVYAGFADERVLNRQIASKVWRMWRVYQFKLATGLLNQSLF